MLAWKPPLTVTLPPSNVVQLLLVPSRLGLDVLTDSTVLVSMLQILRICKLGAARLPHSGLPLTAKFHVAPFEVAAPIIDPLVITHPVRSAAL